MEVVIRPQTSWWKLDWKELWLFRDMLYILTWRDIKVRYKQTVLGLVWVLLQPLVSTIIFTIFFGNFVKIPSGNLPYSIFVLVGLIFWNFFSQALNRASFCLVENHQLVTKVYFPREILPFAAVATVFVDFVVSLVLLVGALFIFHIQPTFLFILLAIVGTITTALASCGLGMLLAAVNVTYRDVRYILPFFLQLLVFVSPVIYPLDIVRPSLQFVIALNPMSGIIDALRSSLSHNAIDHPQLLIISIVSSLVLFMVGLLYYGWAKQKFADIL